MAQEQETQHALLIPWGRFASEIGLTSGIAAVKLHQKHYRHTPNAKVLEFLVAILSGTKYLQEISLAAHPLDKDVTVAQAWGQESWADYSGISRTLSQLSWEEVRALVAVLQQVSQPFIQQELHVLRRTGQPLQYDGDLTGLPVSNSSQSYPHAAYGHMADAIQLGYQAAVVSLQSPTYGRLWLSVEHHAGDTVSYTEAEALVLAAEACTGLRPRRRTELLQSRLAACVAHREAVEKRGNGQQVAVEQAEQAQQAVVQQLQEALPRPESKATHLPTLEQRCARRAKAVEAAQQRLQKTQCQLLKLQAAEQALRQRLARFEQENAENADPIAACFRLDAGFGTYDNIALLIELGYEVYTKLPNHRSVLRLSHLVPPETSWTRVGHNAEMLAWAALSLEHCPYPLDVALERFHTGDTLKHSALAHFGATAVTADLPTWFHTYNQRQTIEAGIKEAKQVFYLQRLKVRSEPAIYLQEALTVFAANFIRWATHWIEQQVTPQENTLTLAHMGIKQQVQVAAHTSAHVIHTSEGMLLRFSPDSVLAGKQLFFRALGKPPHPNYFGPLFAILTLIVQKLR